MRTVAINGYIVHIYPVRIETKSGAKRTVYYPYKHGCTGNGQADLMSFDSFIKKLESQYCKKNHYENLYGMDVDRIPASVLCVETMDVLSNKPRLFVRKIRIENPFKGDSEEFDFFPNDSIESFDMRAYELRGNDDK